MSEVKRYGICGFEGGVVDLKDGHLVHVDDFDRVTAERDVLQQRLTAADERWDRLETLTNDDLIAIARHAALNSVHRYNYMPCLPEEANNWEPHYWVIEAMRAALKPAECCTVSAEDRALLEAGDYTPEELFGVGGKPSCPKCFKP